MGQREERVNSIACIIMKTIGIITVTALLLVAASAVPTPTDDETIIPEDNFVEESTSTGFCPDKPSVGPCSDMKPCIHPTSKILIIQCSQGSQANDVGTPGATAHCKNVGRMTIRADADSKCMPSCSAANYVGGCWCPGAGLNPVEVKANWRDCTVSGTWNYKGVTQAATGLVEGDDMIGNTPSAASGTNQARIKWDWANPKWGSKWAKVVGETYYSYGNHKKASKLEWGGGATWTKEADYGPCDAVTCK